MKKFDERGEAAIARLRLDPDFNEELYRKLGPVQYWTHVNARKARGIPTTSYEIPSDSQRCCARMRHPDERCIELRGHGPVTDHNGDVWDHRTVVQGNPAFWRKVPKAESDAFFRRDEPVETAKPTKKHDKAAILATRIVVIGAALSIALVVCTIAAMICMGLWNVFIA